MEPTARVAPPHEEHERRRVPCFGALGLRIWLTTFSGTEGLVMDADLDGITPNWEFLPPGVQSMFESAAGTALMIGLGICVIGFVVAGVRLLFARSYGMYGAGADAKTQFLWSVVGTLVVASSVSFVVWLAGQAAPTPTDETPTQQSAD